MYSSSPTSFAASQGASAGDSRSIQASQIAEAISTVSTTCGNVLAGRRATLLWHKAYAIEQRARAAERSRAVEALKAQIAGTG